VPRSLDTDGAGDVNLQGVALPPDLVQLSTFTGGAGGRGGGSSSSSSSSNAAAAGVRGYVKVCVKVYLTHSGDKAATNVSLVLSGPGFLHTVPKNVVIQRIGGTAASTPVMVKFFVYATKAQLPSGLDVQVVATYTAPGGEPRIATHAVTLPLHIACRPKAAAKNAAHKLTLDTAGAPTCSSGRCTTASRVRGHGASWEAEDSSRMWPPSLDSRPHTWQQRTVS
jgi:hypothetical protein